MLLRPDMIVTGRVWLASAVRLVGVVKLLRFVTLWGTQYEFVARRGVNVFSPNSATAPGRTFFDDLADSFSFTMLVPLLAGVVCLVWATPLARLLMPVPKESGCPGCGYRVGHQALCPECGMRLRDEPLDDSKAA